ncbi:MAG: NAD(P)-binding domain-containing protein [Candidatus Fibromonas sp.]|jgi:hypothetical protein|nr:NAD(P)-binding domain-containing protein [Candidatus Fibromonas sp.]
MAKPNIHRLALDYFIKHQKELCKKYKGKELLMRGAKVIGAYNSFHEAATEGRR